MRCYACGRALNDYESTLKSAVSGEYLDMCNKCLKDLNIKTIGREDLSAYEDAEDDCCVDYETDGDEE